MITILLTLGILVLLIFIMSIGAIFSNRVLRGSCGGTGESCTCSDNAKKQCHSSSV